MSYVGFSYGTAIGLEYLELFPGAHAGGARRRRRPRGHLTDLLGQAAAFDRVVDEMFASCPAGQEGGPDGVPRAPTRSSPPRSR